MSSDIDAEVLLNADTLEEGKPAMLDLEEQEEPPPMLLPPLHNLHAPPPCSIHHWPQCNCHTHHASMTVFRPIWGNTVEVAPMTSSVMYINSHTKGTSLPLARITTMIPPFEP